MLNHCNGNDSTGNIALETAGFITMGGNDKGRTAASKAITPHIDTGMIDPLPHKWGPRRLWLKVNGKSKRIRNRLGGDCERAHERNKRRDLRDRLALNVALEDFGIVFPTWDERDHERHATTKPRRIVAIYSRRDGKVTLNGYVHVGRRRGDSTFVGAN